MRAKFADSSDGAIVTVFTACVSGDGDAGSAFVVDLRRLDAQTRFSGESIVDVHVHERRSDGRNGEVELLPGFAKAWYASYWPVASRTRITSFTASPGFAFAGNGTETSTRTWRSRYPDSFGPALTCSETGSNEAIFASGGEVCRDDDAVRRTVLSERRPDDLPELDVAAFGERARFVDVHADEVRNLRHPTSRRG